VFLLINVFTPGASFADLQRATCRVVNADSEQELARFELRNLKGNGLVFGQLVRNKTACPECHGKRKGLRLLPGKGCLF
jgi:stress response protein SCP2